MEEEGKTHWDRVKQTPLTHHPTAKTEEQDLPSLPNPAEPEITKSGQEELWA